MSLKIYSYPHNFKVAKALIAAEYAGVSIVVPDFKFPEENHSAEFRAKHNPNGKIPVLETPHGSLFESNAILRYVARVRSDNTLYGQSFWEHALIDQWLDWTANELESARAVWLLPIYGVLVYNEDAYVHAREDMLKALSILEGHLLRHTFMVGNAITIADISIAAALFGMYKEVFDSEFRGRFPSVQRWFETVANQDEFKKHMGPIAYAANEKKAPEQKSDAKEPAPKEKKPKEPKEPKDKADKKGKEKGDKKGKEKGDKKGKDKADKPAGESAATDKPAAAPAAAGKDDATKNQKSNLDLLDELEKPAKKVKNALDDLPESAMSMDAIKKLCFNQKPYNPNFWTELWSKWDEKGYSFYSTKYKFNTENVEYIPTCNLIGGFVQRADACRKYSFGVVNIVGKDDETPPFTINGAWLFRGPEVIKEMREVSDAEYFEWTKVDVKTPAGRELVEQLFTGANPSNNTDDKLLERRYFK